MIRNLLLIPLAILALVSCRSFDDLSLPFPADRFDIDNEVVSSSDRRVAVFDPLERQEEIRIVGGTVQDLAEYIRINTTCCLVSNVKDLEINGLFVGGVSKIVHDVALANNLKFARIDSTYYLYEGESTMFDVCVVLNCTVSADVLKSLFSGDFTIKDGKCIFRGSLDDALRLQTVLDSLNDIVSNNYVVTVVQLETSKQLAYNLQVDVGSKGVDLLEPGVTAWDVFSAVARVSGAVLDFDNYHERQFYVSDGQRMTYNQTFDKKLEQRAVSDQGTSTVSGYTDVQAGSIIELLIKSSNNGNVLLSYDLELSSFDSSSIDKHVVKVSSEDVNLRLGQIYYVASSQDKTVSNSLRVLGLGKDNNDLVTTIFVKIDKIAR